MGSRTRSSSRESWSWHLHGTLGERNGASESGELNESGEWAERQCFCCCSSRFQDLFGLIRPLRVNSDAELPLPNSRRSLNSAYHFPRDIRPVRFPAPLFGAFALVKALVKPTAGPGF